MHAYVVNMHICVCACCIYVETRSHSQFSASFVFYLIQVLIYLFILSFLRQDLLLNLELSNSARLASELQRLSCGSPTPPQRVEGLWPCAVPALHEC